MAYKGSPNQCDGEDWVELFNNSTNSVDILNYTLHDDNGKDDEDANIFESNVIESGDFKVL